MRHRTGVGPGPAGSPLYELPDVLPAPRVAGALGEEIHRTGDFALEENAVT
ncbi:hypothetical protein ABZ154_27025 [Streptomyces sp. NPDC006261]|uniref:hypothetical protein n=1 Tax=Streptomyces sp. NPDC006261 TaxID=3156739 RepID=UPI0033AB7F12